MIRRNKLQLLKFDGKDNSLYFVMDSTNSIYFYGAEAKEGIVFRLNYAYVLDKLKKHNYLSKKQIIDIGDYINEKISNRIRDELRIYVLNNINRYDFYSTSFIFDIKNKINQDLVTYETRYHSYSYDFSEINHNIVLVKHNYIDGEIKIDLFTGEMEFFKKGQKINCLDYYFCENFLNTIIAQEQYKRGIAPKMLNELVKLQEFLDNKCSVKIITKDNNEHTYKSRYGRNASNLLDHCNGRFEISKYWLNEDADVNLKDVLYFKYGRKEHYFDTSVLASCIV
ncbi:MAG: hypothetical protein J6J60_08785 [Clostridia bacterium]|nr:hypothetical protein [Clostridia bacterium]MBP3597468.1 hypothetical protein [Clostridia bacterium]